MGVCRTAELLLVASLCVASVPPVPAAEQPPNAEAVLTAARAALGGEERLTRTRSLTMRGRSRQNRGDVQVPIEVEIVCQLPDACVRREEYPAQNIEPSTLGYHGDRLIQSAARPAGAGARLDIDGARQEFARLLLGSFAGAPTRYALSFAYGGEAEAPEGRADVIDITGSGGFSAQFVIHRVTHLPVMLLWKTVAAAPPGARPPSDLTAGARPPASVEHRLYYGDYRDVQGTKWPFRLRHAVGGTTVDETTFDRIAVNDRIDPRKFEVAK